MSFLDYVYAILAILVILALAYLCTKFVASKSGGSAIGGRSTNMYVVDRIFLGKDKQLIIVLIADAAYLVGVSNQEITLLDRLDMDGLILPEDKKPLTDAMGARFQDVLKKAAERFNKR